MTAIQFRENLPDMTEVGTDSEEPYKVDKGLDQVLRRSVVSVQARESACNF